MNVVRNASLEEMCMRKTKSQENSTNVVRTSNVRHRLMRKLYFISINTINLTQYLWTWRQSVVPNDGPQDFGPGVAFGDKFQIPVARQGGREMSAPRPYETDPFHSLSSIYK